MKQQIDWQSPAWTSLGVSKQAIDFMQRAIERDPNKRWSAEDLLLHDWLQDVDIAKD